MISDLDYTHLNQALATHLRSAEEIAISIAEYWKNRMPSLLFVDGRYLDMEANVMATIDGLSHSEASVRIASLQGLADKWKNHPLGAESLKRIALTDPNLAVQLYAISMLSGYVGQYRDDQVFLRQLAELALASEDVTLRHSIYLSLCVLSEMYDISVYRIKYVAYPLVFDEEFVKGFI